MLALVLAASLLAQASPVASPAATAAPVATATPEVGANANLVLPPVPAIDAHPVVPAGAPSADLVGVATPFVGLALPDAIGMALAKNTDLAVAQSNRRIARWQIVAAEGAYDLRFAIAPAFSFGQTPAVSPFQAGPNGAPPLQDVLSVNGGVQQRTPGGGTFGITTNASRTHSTSSFNGYDPYYETGLALNFTQPLARGLRMDDARRQLQISRINRDLSSDAALLTASNTLGAVLNAYYDLVAAWKNVGIQEDALRQALAQAQSNERLVKRGAAAPVDVIESNTQVQTYQDDVYSAIQNVGRLQNQLKQLILSDPADPIWTANLVPTTPRTGLPPEPSLNDVVVAAIRGRPEIAQVRDSMRSADVNVAYAGDQRKPQIDLNLSGGLTGFAGNPTPANANPLIASSAAQIAAINALIARVNANLQPGQTPLQPLQFQNTTVPANTVGGLSTAYSSMFSGRYPAFSIGATIGFPLRNRTAEGLYQVALEQRRQLETQQTALVQRIQTEARNALQTYRTARSRLIAAGAARAAAEAVAASEARRFRAGQSTTFLVLQRQVNLATQRGRELQAETDLQKALVELDRVTGDILKNNNVDVSTLGGAGR